ncbi:MAG: 3-hydroxyacyl-CoA dehydrogenase NAD-binding domain-containing protein [Candidatus Acidiferrales bacterium]
MEIKTIGVIGAGAMGRGIAYASALGGYRTVLEDVSPEMREQGLSYILQTLEDEVSRGKLTLQQKEKALANLSTSRSVEDVCREAELLIEAVPEEMEVKLEIFTIFDKFAKPGAILASNTSSLSITEMASITFRAEDCIGMHFFNPVPEMKLLEIVRALETSEATLQACVEVGRRMGKEVVVIRESPGFVTSRIIAMIGNEAFYMLQEGIASAEDIDKALKLGLNHPTGPFELADLVGLDVQLNILEDLHKTLGEKYRPCPLLAQYVKAGRTGRKSGRGVFEYGK